MRTAAQPYRRDSGSVLPIVLVIVVVLGVVVVATAKYATSTLRYGQVVEHRTDRLSAAEGGIVDIIDRIDNNQLPLCSTAVGGTSRGDHCRVARTTQRLARGGYVQASRRNYQRASPGGCIVTGAGGVPNGDGLVTSGGGRLRARLPPRPPRRIKKFGGPTFVSSLDLLGLGKDIRVETETSRLSRDMRRRGQSCQAGYTDDTGGPDSGGTVSFGFGRTRDLVHKSNVGRDVPAATAAKHSSQPRVAGPGPTRCNEPSGRLERLRGRGWRRSMSSVVPRSLHVRTDVGTQQLHAVGRLRV